MQINFTEIIGIGLVFFSVAWILISLATILDRSRKEQGLSIILTLIALVGFGAFLGLTASTPFRRAYINLPMRELASGLIQNTGGFILGAGLATLIYIVARRISNRQHWRFVAISAVAMLIVFGGVLAWLYSTTFEPDLDQVTTDTNDEALADITMYDNIPIQFFENQVVKSPTAMEVGPEGELYVASLSGFIWVLRDEDKDNVADTVTEFASGLVKPEGLAWSEDGLYVNVAGALVLMTDTNGDDKSDTTKTIVDGFPSESYAFHQNNGLVFGPDGRLYLGSGSTTDHRPETNEKAARIFSMNPDGSDFKVFATGVRNPYGLIPAPDGNGFFAVDNGSSGCLDTEFETDDCSDPIDVPEEVNYIIEGGDYGFPNYFGLPPEDSGTLPPVVTLPDHSAPTGIELYQGDKLPERYVGRLIVTMWLRNEVVSIILYKIDDQHYTGSVRTLIEGLIGPSSVVNSPTGGLYISSFSGNAIYYVGNP
ncbi:MAG: PQQ-dependent sugar dehydrogenase [Chloroflexi bacterium]|nr:PQQ-dependent sugar dehydrogenase [Chloroflexota bacterium]MCC6897277.1 PQQ-dependent sugar dehydrogenase [Anaerolineae bacterium]